MSAPDVPAAIVAYLRSTDVAILVDTTKITRPDLPQADDQKMPQARIIVRRDGGGARYGGGTLALSDPRISVYCYGSSRLEADHIAAAVELALVELPGGRWANVSVKSANVAGQVPTTDPATGWPCAYLSAQVTVGRESIA